ncbi:transcriptional regulator, RpiR family [Sulfobacillus acidophilus TPY]|uniref:Transcriptional regulator, RpiR family n=1 Tax=Sulfobacillus acidophilus (strain ATCC 700253 / DSM 10332 / NAL) TaxID=679936 RepID=G8TVL8_SULAD|nr:transcriptional regulator, RpiR family [Sulfobacillus acidophilus TPY]AEW03657.1 transcriptional regulator, RpiR family [Sulfobacillus acidophilus DSM 10332]
MASITLDELRRQVDKTGDLSPVNRQIAAFIADHLREVSLMTATELAEAAQVSQASVTRFCTALGFSGFSEFVRVLQDLIREEWQAPERVRYLKPAADDDPLLTQERQNLERLPAICRSPAVDEAVRFILEAPRLVLAGARASATLIPYAAYFFSKVRDRVEIATPGTILWDALASRPQPDTAVFTFVFPRYPAVLLQWIKDLTQWGTPVAAMTDRERSPVRAWADPCLVVPVASASLFDSYAAPLVLTNYLIRQVAAKTPDIARRLEAIEQYDITHHVYVRAGKGPAD